MKLNKRERVFCEEILKGKSQREAYTLARYKAKSPAVADANASILIRKHKVAGYIAERQAEIAKELEKETLVTMRDVVLELKRLGFSRLNRILSFSGSSVTLKSSDEIADDDMAAIESIKETKDGISVKLHDKIQPLVKIGEHLGGFEPDAADPSKPRTVNVNVRVYGSKREYKFDVTAN